MRTTLLALALTACGGEEPSPPDLGVDASVPRAQSCVASFTGGVSGPCPCAMTITYSMTSGSFTLSTNGRVVPDTQDTWTGVHITKLGEPGVGALATTLDTTMQLTDLGDPAAPAWLESSSQSVGSLTAQLDDLGPYTSLGGDGRLYSTPHGRVDAILHDTSTMHALDAVVAVTF